MSKSVAVRFDDHLIWVYDEALALLLKFVIDVLAEKGLDAADGWATKVAQFRATAALGADVGLDLDGPREHWQAADYPLLCDVIAEACASLG